jgi:glucose-6-phosphate-specific signal transduction histidine kinase
MEDLLLILIADLNNIMYLLTRSKLFYYSILSNILIHLVSQSVTRLGKGVLCSRKLSAVGRTMAADFERRWASTGGLGMREGQAGEIRF